MLISKNATVYISQSSPEKNAGINVLKCGKRRSRNCMEFDTQRPSHNADLLLLEITLHDNHLWMPNASYNGCKSLLGRSKWVTKRSTRKYQVWCGFCGEVNSNFDFILFVNQINHWTILHKCKNFSISCGWFEPGLFRNAFLLLLPLKILPLPLQCGVHRRMARDFLLHFARDVMRKGWSQPRGASGRSACRTTNERNFVRMEGMER